MLGLCGTIGHFQPRNVLVVGDLILDKYTIGHARRISPEAPVAVVHVANEEQRPGGAGNVILNLASLGARVRAIGRVGDDTAAETLLSLLKDEGIDTTGIFKDSSAPTPVKNRIIAGGQQIVRVDYETPAPISSRTEAAILAKIPQMIDGIDVVAISDYGKGVVTPGILKALIDQAQQRNIPVIADPKGTDFTRYSGATILKPNKSEAYAAAGLGKDVPIDEVAAKLHQQVNVKALMVTRSEEGISIFHSNGKHDHYPVQAMEVKDVTGAGDTVLAVVTFAIANGLAIGEAAQLGNEAAVIAISHFGCARVSLPMLAKRLLEKDASNKIFDDKHLYAFQEIIKGHRFAALEISLAEGLQASHFEEIQRLSEDRERELAILIKEQDPPPSLLKLLASLQHVNYIILNGPTEEQLRRCIDHHKALGNR